MLTKQSARILDEAVDSDKKRIITAKRKLDHLDYPIVVTKPIKRADAMITAQELYNKGLKACIIKDSNQWVVLREIKQQEYKDVDFIKKVIREVPIVNKLMNNNENTIEKYE